MQSTVCVRCRAPSTIASVFEKVQGFLYNGCRAAYMMAAGLPKLRVQGCLYVGCRAAYMMAAGLPLQWCAIAFCSTGAGVLFWWVQGCIFHGSKIALLMGTGLSLSWALPVRYPAVRTFCACLLPLNCMQWPNADCVIHSDSIFACYRLSRHPTSVLVKKSSTHTVSSNPQP